MEGRLWRVVEDWNFWEKPPETGVWRDAADEALRFAEGGEAVYLFGPRQAGKTTVCLQLISALSKKFGRESCLYLNLEEPAFVDRLNTNFLQEVVEGFVNARGKKPRFVFLDEIQNVRAWEKWVRTVVDKKMFKVFVTGSNARLLSSEFSTSLGGRGVGIQVLPFSFKEFKRARSGSSLEDYFRIGGYPLAVLEKDDYRRQRLLSEYFETAIAKDIISRYRVRDSLALKTLAVYLLTNVGKPFTYNKLRAATGLSFDSLRQYLKYLEDIFLVFEVQALSYSLKKAMEMPRKYYAFDLGIQGVVSKSFSPDFGKKAENSAGIELKRRQKEIQYYSDGYEVDFVVKDGLSLTAVNVCYGEKTPARENNALKKFREEHKNSAEGLLLGKKKLEEWLSD